MKKILLILALFIGLIAQSQTKNLYRLQFDSIEHAQSVQLALMDSGYVALDVRGHGYFEITPQIITEALDTIPAVLDTMYSASVVTKILVPELMPYVVNKPWWNNHYAGEQDYNVIQPLIP